MVRAQYRKGADVASPNHSSWPIDPELLPWWRQISTNTAYEWRNSRIPHLRVIFFSMTAAWVVFAVVLALLETSPVQLLPWFFWPTMAILLSLFQIRITLWLLILYWISAAGFLVTAGYAWTHATVGPQATAAVFVVMAVFHAILPLIGRHYASAASADREIPPRIRGCQTFGHAGARLAEVQGWRPAAIQSGITGETRTAELLENYVTRIPGARIFHSLRWPGARRADVDHAVLCGRRLMLIDSKHWPPGFYTFAPNGNLLRNGNPFRGSEIHLPHAVSGYQRLLPGYDVRGLILIHPNRRGTVDTTVSPIRRLDVVNVLNFLNGPCAWLAEEPVTVYVPAAALLRRMTRS
jgi:hypothetical protein